MNKLRQRALDRCGSTRGVLMVEAMLVIIIVLFVLFLVLELAFFLFQQAHMTVVANDTAVRMGQSYRFLYSDYMIGFVEPEDVTKVSPFRHFFNSSEDHFDEVAAEKCERLAQYQLAKRSLLKMKGRSTTHTEIVQDGMGRRHIEVTVSATFEMPGLGIVRRFLPMGELAPDNTYTMTTTGRAECPDVIDYVSSINCAKQIMSGSQLNSSGVKLLGKILSAAARTKKAFIKVLDLE